MPFQLSTQMYGGGGDGGGGRQASPFGQLGALMELQMRRENLESQKAQRELINEQRQQAIEKNEAAKRRDAGLITLLQNNPRPTMKDLAPVLGSDTPKFFEEYTKALYTVTEKKTDRLAAGVKAIKYGWQTDEGRKAAWDAFQQTLLQEKTLTPEETMEYSPQLLDELYMRSLTPVQQSEIITAEKRAETDAATEARNKEEHDLTKGGKKGESIAKERASVVQALRVAPTPEAYSAIVANASPDVRLTLPTVEAFVKDRKGTLSNLLVLGQTPEQMASDADRDADRWQRDRHHKESEARLVKQYGEGVLTSQMYQTALRRRADDEQALAVRISNAKRDNKPMSQFEIDDERLRIAQAHDDELRLPPSLNLADRRKKVMLDALEAELKERNTAEKVDGQDQPLRNPMTPEELKERKGAIQNVYLSWLGKEPPGAAPVGGAPTPTPTPRPQAGPQRPLFGGAPPPAAAGPAPGPRPMFGGGPPPPPAGSGMLGDLMAPPPPQLPQFGPGSAPLAGPPRGAPPPGAAPPPTADPAVMRQVADINAKIDVINKQLAAPGPKDVQQLKRDFDTLAAQRKQLIGK